MNVFNPIGSLANAKARALVAEAGDASPNRLVKQPTPRELAQRKCNPTMTRPLVLAGARYPIYKSLPFILLDQHHENEQNNFVPPEHWVRKDTDLQFMGQ